jgi:hypothetical protein
MKICYLTSTLNPRTGTGQFASHIVEGTKKYLPEGKSFVLTRENYLQPSFFSILKNWFEIRRRVKNATLVHALDGYPYGVIAG